MTASVFRSLAVPLAGVLLVALLAGASWAKDGGGSSGGSSGGGSSAGGTSGGGGSGSGSGTSGSGNSGSGGSNGGSGSSGSSSSSSGSSSNSGSGNSGASGSSSGTSGGSARGDGASGGSSAGSRDGAVEDGWGVPAQAGPHHGGRRDQDVARDAVANGAAVPLSRVLPVVRQAAQGEVLDVRLRRQGSTLVYDVTVLSPTGEYRSVVVDARRNRVLGMEGR